MKKTLIAIFTSAILLLGIGLSYSYFTGVITGEGKKLKVAATELRILFTDSSSLSNNEIEPGWKESKTFSVKNESDDSFNYNIVFENLVNTFVTEGFLQYKITSSNGYNMEGYLDIPKSSTPTDIVLAYDIDIPVDITHEYTIEFVYHDSDTVDQSEDMGKVLSGNLAIVEGTVNPNIKYTVTMNSDNGFITPTSNETVKKGNLEFEVTPNTGFDINSMSVLCTPVANTVIVDNKIKVNDIRQDHNCEISFDKELYTVNIVVNNGKSDALNKVVEHGGSGTATITPNYGYTLENATVSGTGCSFNDETGELLISNVQSNGTCTVTLPRDKYTVTLAGTGISTSNSPQEAEYEGSTSINFTLSEGYELGENVINCDNGTPNISGNVLTVSNVTADTTCTLSPVLKSYDVTLIVNGGTPTSETKSVTHNGSTTYTIANSMGYKLELNGSITCTGNAVGSLSGSTVTISGVTTTQACTVNLKKQTYTVNVGVNNSTMGSVSPANSTVNHGDNLSVTITPASGYKYSSNTCGLTPSNNTLTFTKITSSISCNVTFELDIIYLTDAILRDNVVQDERSDFTTKLDNNTTGKVFSTTRTFNGNKVYYYSGNTSNNWVKFANLYWRIIRTDENGGVRLLYVGDSPDTTKGFIDNTNYKFNSEASTTYVGFMYGTAGSLVNNRKNENSSIAKEKLDDWYINNISNKNDGKISYKYYLNVSTKFCNDRSGEGYLTDGLMYYAGYKRLVDAKYPTYKCGGNTNNGYYSDYSVEDRFTANNHLLNPVGLMTADEIVFAGGLYDTDNINVWYNLNAQGNAVTGNESWWTMTPFRTDAYGAPRNFVISNTGKLGFNYTFSENAIRPVVTLKADVLVIKGNGTSGSPYELLYEIENESTLAKVVKKSYPPQPGRTNFSVTDNETPTLYTDTDDQGTTYYFSGDGTNMNNWVSFAGSKWRIIRINGNGSVRLLYAGDGNTGSASNNYNGVGSSSGKSAYNNEYNHPSYVGWKYTKAGSLAGDRGNGTASTIYNSVNSWYTGLSATDKNYIDTNAIYCNDRELASGSSYSTSSKFYYATYQRLAATKGTPKFTCSSTSDRFNTFGLMTADEVVAAGGLYGTNSPKAYYYLNASGNGSITGDRWWWTMSPYVWNGSNAVVFQVRGSSYPGDLTADGVISSYVVRPVISLKSNVLVTGGSGTGSRPYTLEMP